VNYLANHIDHMNYADYKNLGLPIGSGIVESTCKWLIQQRFKGVGMRWSDNGFVLLCNLRVAWVNETFHELFFDNAPPQVVNTPDAYLKEHGLSVSAEYKFVELNESIEVNGRSPYRIVAEWLDPKTNKPFVFKSGNLWRDPSDHIDQKQITVYVDKNNPKKYSVDTSFLPAEV